jgi:hypothetical protein
MGRQSGGISFDLAQPRRDAEPGWRHEIGGCLRSRYMPSKKLDLLRLMLHVRHRCAFSNCSRKWTNLRLEGIHKTAMPHFVGSNR